MTKVYIDGSEGTTGLRINERFKGRDDIEILTMRKNISDVKRIRTEKYIME
jgi:N-acetyl-gamma-glutamyl-phosphate reductase